MRKIYVAGAMSAPNSLEFLNNLRKGIQLTTRVFYRGYAPFCPFTDFHYALQMSDSAFETLNVEKFYAYSMAWLEVSDAVLVVPGWEKSKGTKLEIERATVLHIPVFYSLESLMRGMPPNGTD